MKKITNTYLEYKQQKAMFYYYNKEDKYDVAVPKVDGYVAAIMYSIKGFIDSKPAFSNEVDNLDMKVNLRNFNGKVFCIDTLRNVSESSIATENKLQVFASVYLIQKDMSIINLQLPVYLQTQIIQEFDLGSFSDIKNHSIRYDCDKTPAAGKFNLPSIFLGNNFDYELNDKFEEARKELKDYLIDYQGVQLLSIDKMLESISKPQLLKDSVKFNTLVTRIKSGEDISLEKIKHHFCITQEVENILINIINK